MGGGVNLLYGEWLRWGLETWNSLIQLLWPHGVLRSLGEKTWDWILLRLTSFLQNTDPNPSLNLVNSSRPVCSGLPAASWMASMSIQFSSVKEKTKKEQTHICRTVIPCNKKKKKKKIHLTTSSQNLLGCCYSNPDRKDSTNPHSISSWIHIPDSHPPSGAVSLTLHPLSEDPEQRDKITSSNNLLVI